MLVAAALFGAGCLLGRPGCRAEALLLVGLAALLLLLACLAARPAGRRSGPSAPPRSRSGRRPRRSSRCTSGDRPAPAAATASRGGRADADGSPVLRLVGIVRGDALERDGRAGDDARRRGSGPRRARRRSRGASASRSGARRRGRGWSTGNGWRCGRGCGLRARGRGRRHRGSASASRRGSSSCTARGSVGFLRRVAGRCARPGPLPRSCAAWRRARSAASSWR